MRPTGTTPRSRLNPPSVRTGPRPPWFRRSVWRGLALQRQRELLGAEPLRRESAMDLAVRGRRRVPGTRSASAGPRHRARRRGAARRDRGSGCRRCVGGDAGSIRPKGLAGEQIGEDHFHFGTAAAALSRMSKMMARASPCAPGRRGSARRWPCLRESRQIDIATPSRSSPIRRSIPTRRHPHTRRGRARRAFACPGAQGRSGWIA